VRRETERKDGVEVGAGYSPPSVYAQSSSTRSGIAPASAGDSIARDDLVGEVAGQVVHGRAVGALGDALECGPIAGVRSLSGLIERSTDSNQSEVMIDLIDFKYSRLS